MSEEVVPYNCDGMESRKRQKATPQAMRARIDAEEKAAKAYSTQKASSSRVKIEAGQIETPSQNPHRKAA